jgi:Glutamine amidotransferase domain
MCGIVAFFSRSLPISEAALQRTTQSLYHRGPDGQRHWRSQDSRVALGHARLSIIDLTTGDQPITSEDGRTQIVVNGEFYGYEAIQRELEQSGHHLRTRSDSEIALHLYEDLGTQWFENDDSPFAATCMPSAKVQRSANPMNRGANPAEDSFRLCTRCPLPNIAVRKRTGMRISSRDCSADSVAGRRTSSRERSGKKEFR